MSRLQGQVAAITGAARGLGFEIASRLAAEGARLVLLDRDAPALAEAASILQSVDLPVSAFSLDVSNRAEVRATFQKIAETVGAPSILVNVAGVYPRSPAVEIDDREWDHVIAVNLTGTFACCAAVLPAMTESGYGRIVNIASSTFDLGAPLLAHYVASKGGVIGLTRVLATEFAQFGITCNAVSPGLMVTEGTKEMEGSADIWTAMDKEQPVKRRGLPADIAEAVAYLASPASSFVTGHTLDVNGGHRYR